MGIKGLTKLLADNAPSSMKEQKFESYFGRKIAIDASMSIYQFLIVVGRSGTEMLTNEAGDVTSHLQGMFNRTVRLLEAGIKPVFVFDGKPPDLKKQELAKRFSKRADAAEDLNDALESGNKDDIEKFSKRTVKVTKQHNEDCKKLLRLMGVPVIEAPSEAEAQCAALCKSSKVYAVASEDMDSLTFGASRFLRHLMDPSSKKIPVMEFEISKVLEELNLTMDQFIDLCILSGCDYCDSIRDSDKTGNSTSAGMYFLHFQVYRMDSTVNASTMTKDPDTAFFKRLEGLQPCEVLELKAGTHIFAVYGDNFFKPATYTIEALCTKTYEDTTHKLKDIEAQILRKRNELRQFETEYRKALAQYQEVTNRYSQEKQSVDDLLKQRDSIHSSFTVSRSIESEHFSNGSSSRLGGEGDKCESPAEEGSSDSKDKSSKRKWFYLNLKGSDKK